jgi:hypothetical protein
VLYGKKNVTVFNEVFTGKLLGNLRKLEHLNGKA